MSDRREFLKYLAASPLLFGMPQLVEALGNATTDQAVEQVLKGLTKAGSLKASKSVDHVVDEVHIIDPEGLKEVYGATRDKVSWWPLK
jgi:hypothetical protein